MTGLKNRADDYLIRAMDVLVAGILIIIFSPLMVIVAIMVLVFIGSPLLYVTKRVGLNGVEYKHCKFKSMLPGKETGRIFFEQDRLNRCGKLLRSLHLDELPELFSIFIGKMSFVGPRPLPRYLLDGLDTSLRETVPPGWTGPGQVWLLKNGSLDKQHQIELDNKYVEKRSLLLNLKIIAMTIVYSFQRKKIDLAPDSTDDRVKYGGGIY